MKILNLILLFTLVSICCGSDRSLHLGEFRIYQQEGTERKITYSVYLPENYALDRKWPLLVFLHGGGMRGAKPETVQEKGVGIKVSMDENFPFVLLMPQCPPTVDWRDKEVMDAVVNSIKEVQRVYSINELKIYLTGNSMGGIGTWHIANYAPDLFTAIAPLSGYATFNDASNLGSIPIWAFHGALDDIIPLQLAEKTVALVREHNSNLKFTILPEAGHRPWKQIYRGDKIYSWLLKHTKTSQ